jgi:hypothetical protein
LTAKTLVYEGWKSLDFLGFSRPNRAFSMGYAGFSLKEISRALLPVAAALAGMGASDLGVGKRRIVHRSQDNQVSVFLQ